MLKVRRDRNKDRVPVGVTFDEVCGCVTTSVSRAERALEKAQELRFESPWRIG
jgi:hypothetical protein